VCLYVAAVILYHNQWLSYQLYLVVLPDYIDSLECNMGRKSGAPNHLLSSFIFHFVPDSFSIDAIDTTFGMIRLILSLRLVSSVYLCNSERFV